jgi:hypothetical protein
MGSAAKIEVDLKVEPEFESEVLEMKAKGMLYTTEQIPKDSVFALRMLVHRDEKESLDALKSTLIRGLPDEGIGGGKSRGAGKVGIDRVQVKEVTTEELEERAKKINTRHFLVRLLSPMVLDIPLLEAKTLCDGASRAYTWMFHKGKPKLPSIEAGAKLLSSEMFSGWSLKDGGRKRIETAISPGSLFEFKSVEHDDILGLALAALEYCSIGSYKPYGCGQVIIESAR